MAGILGRKIGMTQLFAEEGERMLRDRDRGRALLGDRRARARARRLPGAVQLAFGETKERRLGKPQPVT